MMRFLRTSLLLVSFHATPALAQRLAPSAATRASLPIEQPMRIVVADRPAAWPYVLTGTLVGMGAMVAGLVIYFEQTNDELLGGPFVLAPAVLAAGVVGGVGGYIVYRIRY